MSCIRYSSTKDKIKEKQKELNKKFTPIKFVRDKPKTLADILYKLISQKSKTVYTEVFEEQCDAQRSRSIEDAYLVCKYYIPKINLRTVVSALKELEAKEIIRASFCSTVRRVVHNRISYSCRRSGWANALGKLNIEVKYERTTTTISKKDK